jgi:HEAT repeat protein
MRDLLNGLAIAAISLGGALIDDPTRVAPLPAAQAEQELPPPPTLQGDPADSLYRVARNALQQRNYRRAADLFAQITAKHPNSGYAGDALYWQAFALYRLGSDEQLRRALKALDTQRSRYAKAATRGDAAALERRIQGELAQRGDPEAARSIREAASALAVPPVPPAPPAPPAAPAPPTPPVPPAPPASPEGCDDDDDERLAALNALHHMDEARAMPVLRKVLARRDPGSACLRRKAVFLVAQHEVAGAEDLLLESARSDPDAEVRSQAVFWLSQVGTDKAVVALDSILRTTKDPEIQDKAVFALSQHGSERAQAALHAYAQRTDIGESIREKAIFWIGQSGSAADEAFLRNLYPKLQSDELKKKLLFSISQTGTKESLGWLLDVARNRNEPLEMRKQALFWAGQQGATGADLARLYDSFAERELREHLIFVMAQDGDRAAADKLLEIARKDPNPELRKKALFWLGQIDDPRAAKVLEEIISQ